MCYDIYMGPNEIGKAEMIREGLYMRIRCFCNIKKKGIYRIHMCGSDKTVDLGVCVPQNSGYAVDTKIAVKNIPGGSIRFELNDSTKHCDGPFIRLDLERPFSQLSKLEKARLKYHNGEMMLMIESES